MITRHEASGLLFFISIFLIRISWPAALALIATATMIQIKLKSNHAKP